jgi:hypothetical protein
MDSEIHHRDTEDTEGAQRKSYKHLRVLCALCVCGGEFRLLDTRA